ncbi:zinc ribbon domain-containing protein [Selenomonas sp. F0473]|uniref:zinc ribbon domain-containing protein n=1 Tax=Selenomonas sp. F0473 TaxID=999423 RepID=UPI00029E82FB|nr:zinc ribbon domain-containing protein [Selenomonas sp. F0473]EKU72079.1 hypothetical protein HMPREF9161_00764 [Selenomonas sp. F0473]
MICKECGEKISGITRICPHCGERALVDDELETWSFIADTAEKHRSAMPAAVVPAEPSAVPNGLDAQIAGLERLKTYFTKHSNLFQVVEDLASMEGGKRRPSIGLWGLGGGLAAALFYLTLSPFLPHFVWAYFFVLWGAVTSIGYLRAGRKYERRKAEHDLFRRRAENELCTIYNACEDCFLPIEWTVPPRIARIVSALRTGEANSVQEFLARGV